MKTVLSFTAAFAGFVTLCSAIPTPSTYSVHEKRVSLPRLWSRSSRVERDAILPIRIGLTQMNLDDGYDHLMDVSHPSSPNFGAHWTEERVNDLFAPSEHCIQTVRSWLLSSGIAPQSIVHADNRGWIALNLPAWKAEDLFQTEYHEHVHATSGAVRIGSDAYSLPTHVREHVDYITPGVKFSAAVRKSEVKKRDVSSSSRVKHTPGPKKAPVDQAPWTMPSSAWYLPDELRECGRNMTPTCFKAMYEIPPAPRDPSPLDVMGLYESGDIYSQQDLDSFFAEYAPYVPQGTHPKLDSVDGGEAPVSPGSTFNTGESDIDMDISFSIIYPQTITLYQVDDNIEAFTDGGFNTFLDALDGSYCNYTAYNITGDSPGVDAVYPDPAAGGYKGPLACGTFKPTRVISVSYGVSEYDAPLNYTRRQCNEFLKLGLQGHTFVWASGDYGVASFPGDDSANGCLGENATVYNPSFPTCPYVTNVGATRLYDDQTIFDRESALQANLGVGYELFASAGGFANYFPAPAYQASALKRYFAEHDPQLPYYTINADATNIGANDGVYNRAGRGFPDVSANGAQLRAFVGQVNNAWWGTSLAAPIWGGVITLINQERTSIGKGPVGFINPTLYENTWVFNDIVNGSNPGCDGPGFKAVEGWDPVTGLGTPNFPRLLALFLSLP